VSDSEYIEKYYKHLLTQAKKISHIRAHDMVQDLAVIMLGENGYSGDRNCIKSRHNYSWGILLNMNRENNKSIKKSYDDISLDENNISEKIGETKIELDIFDTLYETELRYEGYSDHQVQRLSRIMSHLKKMSPSKRQLYKLYFEDRLSYREIAKRVGIPMSSIYYLINGLKRELYTATLIKQKKIY